MLNIGQINSKYVCTDKTTIEKERSTSVKIGGLITVTFPITLNGTFLPIKFICGGKTVQSLPKFDFLEDRSLSTYLKHYSNIAESIKLIK